MTTTAPATRPSQTDNTPIAQFPTETMRWGTLLVLTGTFMSILDFFIINVAIPSVQGDLHASAAAIQWIVAGFALAIASLVITGGRLGDLMGRRRAYGIGLAIFTLASAACGLAPSAGLLVAGRLVQGAAAALMMPQVLVIIQATFAGKARVRGLTAYGLTMGVAAVFGLLIQVDLAGLGWRACFLLNVPIGVLALILLRRYVPDAPRTGQFRLDLVGVALSGAALFAIVLPLMQGQSQGWPTWTWISFAVAAVLIGEFGWYERRLVRRGGQPLIDLAMFRERSITAGLTAQLAFNSGLASFFFIFALFVQDGHGFTALQSGTLFGAIGIGYLITSSLAGRIAGILGPQTVALGGILFYGVPAGTGQATRISDGFGAGLYFLVAVNAAVVVLVQLLPRDRTEVAA